MVMEWRVDWDPFDPLRPCYTCGGSPAHFLDRERNEPAYGCSHEPIFESPDDPPYYRWSTRGTQQEWDRAYRRAAKIIRENDERGWKTKFTPSEGELNAKARGIMSEIVAARLTGLDHNLTFLRSGYRRSRKKADIGSNVEVRNTKHHDGDLALYDNDPDSRIALLVTGIDPFVLRGWIRVKDGRLRNLYRAKPAPERWLVPQAMLHPLPLPDDA
jgi:hypothetical protein